MSKPTIEELAHTVVANTLLAGAQTHDGDKAEAGKSFIAARSGLVDLIRAVVVEEITKNNQDHYDQMDRALKRWGA